MPARITVKAELQSLLDRSQAVTDASRQALLRREADRRADRTRLDTKAAKVADARRKAPPEAVGRNILTATTTAGQIFVAGISQLIVLDAASLTLEAEGQTYIERISGPATILQSVRQTLNLRTEAEGAEESLSYQTFQKLEVLGPRSACLAIATIRVWSELGGVYDPIPGSFERGFWNNVYVELHTAGVTYANGTWTTGVSPNITAGFNGVTPGVFAEAHPGNPTGDPYDTSPDWSAYPSVVDNVAWVPGQ